MRSEELNLLSGPIWNKLLMLALPMAAMGILQQIFNAADIAVVGSFVNDPLTAKAAMAAVGSNTTIVNLLINLFVGISLGSNVIIAQFIGQNNKENVNKAVSTSIVVALLGGIFIGVFGECIVNWILTAMGIPAEVFDLAALYLRIYLLGMPVIFLYNFETAIFRSVGNTRTPLVILVFSGLLNVILNLFFVLVFKMTVGGVAIATVVSNAVSAIILFYILLNSKEIIRIDLKNLKVDRTVLREILRIGVPSGIQGMVFSVSNILVQTAVNSLGTVIMAASSAAMNFESFTYFLITSFAQSCTTIVGQNYGAGNYKRCKHSLLVTFLFAFGFFFIIVIVFLSFSYPLLSIFNRDPEVILNGEIRIKIMFFAHIFSLFVEILSSYLRGFGISLIPALCSLTFICGTRILWIYFVFPLSPSLNTLMLVYPLSLAITAAVMIITTFLLRKRLRRDTQEMKEKLA